MRAAVDLAEAGLKVYLVENMPWLGGRVAQLGYMFPTHDCVLCRGTSDHGYGCTRPAISPAFLDNNLHPNIEILTNTDLINLSGYAGDFTVTLRHRPTHVDVERCINCGLCDSVCPVSLPSPFEEKLKARKAIYKMAPRALPDAYVLDKVPRCDTCRRCETVCPTGAVNLDEQETEYDVRVSAIILSLGYALSDPTEYEELGFGRFPNVIHSMQYERLASRSGPTEGVVMRPSDGKRPERIAWLQCVGSRDQKHPYCSSICCMYATKEAMLAKQRIKGIHCEIFMMDERAFNKEFNAYYEQAQKKYGVEYTRCRISLVKEDPETHDLILRHPDADGEIVESRFDMVVLSVGALPPQGSRDLANMLGIELNPYGFCQTDKFAPLSTSKPGIYVCGTFSSPKEIAETILDAAGAAGDVMQLLSNEVGGGQAYGHEYPFLSELGDVPPERDVAGEKPRIGAFVCRCYPSIAGVVDTDAVASFAASLPDVAHVETVEYACLEEGQEQIRRVRFEPGSRGSLQSPHPRVAFPTRRSPGRVEPLFARNGKHPRALCLDTHGQSGRSHPRGQRTDASGGSAGAAGRASAQASHRTHQAGVGDRRRRLWYDGGAERGRRRVRRHPGRARVGTGRQPATHLLRGRGRRSPTAVARPGQPRAGASEN